MRVVYLSLSFLAFATPAALAQDATTGFDPAAAVRGFLTDAAVLGADSATIGALSEDGDTITVENVAMHWAIEIPATDETVTVHIEASIPTLSVTGLAPAASGEGHQVDDLAIPTGTLTVDVEGAPEEIHYELAFTNYSMTGGEWGPFPVIKADPAAPLSRFAPLIDWSVSQSYQRSGAESVTGLFIAGDDRQNLSYGPAFFGPVVDGRLERLEYGPFSVTQTTEMPTPEGETKPIDVTIDYGKFVAEGIDLNPFAQLLTGNGDATGLAPILKNFTMGSLGVTAEDQFKMSIGGATAQDLSVNLDRGPLLQKLDPIILGAMAGTPPEPPALIGLVLDLYGTYGIGRYDLTDVSMEGPDVSASLASMTMEGFNSTGLDHFAMEGGSINVPEGEGSLDSIEIRDLKFPDREAFMNLMLGQVMGMPFTPANLAALPTLGGFSIKGLSSNTSGETFKIDLFDLNLSDYVDAIPTNVAIALEGLEMPVSQVQQPMIPMVLGAIGADPLKADLSLTMRYDQATGNFTLDNDTVLGNVGALTASAALSGIPADILKNPMQANMALATAAIDGLTVRFDDSGITPFLVGMMAEQAGISAAEFAEGMAQQVEMQVAMMTGDSGLAQELGATIMAYLDDPQSLLITASPAGPVPLAQLIGAAMTAPQQIPQLLNLVISANP